ncbi:hypothetical protein FRB95_012181 [Tulasnella sp. JGI-2019a]|nr:hypothetical protein FRB93_013475 [Tulasnella sp. JGI-2019a]KAG9035033.1 hypothetical protein FRB95_012181 [Tulasnella sp. JGI-2019a]
MAPIQQALHTLLLLSLEDLKELQEPTRLKDAVIQATRQTSAHLRILVVSPLFNPEDGIQPSHHWNLVQGFLTFLYAEATSVAQAADNVLMNIEVILRDPKHISASTGHDDVKWDRVLAAKTDGKSPMIFDSLRFSVPPTYITIPPHAFAKEKSYTAQTDRAATYPVVALGGTFDHLHPGHKILLSMSAWIATSKVIIGVTDDTLLVNKNNREILEPLSYRMEQVRRFMTSFKPGLELEIVPIQDVYGPTGWDPDIQALVVSRETQSGAASIDKRRAERSLPPLELFIIEVISPSATVMMSDNAKELKEAKMSSTFIRQWIVDQRTKDLEVMSSDYSPRMPGAFPESNG